MEQSKNKRANSMLRLTILLCLVVIAAVTIFTFTSKREETPINEGTVISGRADDTIESNSGKTEKNSESGSKTDTSSVTDAAIVSKSDNSDTSAEVNDKKNEQTEKPVVAEKKESFTLPVSGSVTKEYSIDIPVFSLTMNDYRAHTGIDISCEEGSAVGAAASGVVKEIAHDPMMGTTVTIEHAGGVCTSYKNLNESLPSDITPGAQVNKGQLIGAVGNSAIIEVASEPHLHFEMTLSGAYVDPMKMLDSASISVMSESIVE